MQVIKINIFLLFAMVVFAAKPFIGFSTIHLMANDAKYTILVKSFTKRKQEFVKDSDFDISAVQRRLTEPGLIAVVAFAAFLNRFFRLALSQVSFITGKTLSDLHFKLVPASQLYLLTGKLSI